MSIGEMQACLARLYLNEPFRCLLASDPQVALQAYRLSAEEETAIRELDSTKLESFAISLKNKRRKRFARAFPLLFRVAATEVENLYDRYHALYIPKSRRSIHQDVLDFGEFIDDSLLIASGVPPWVHDVARYERILYATYRPELSRENIDAGVISVQTSSRPRLSSLAVIAEFQYDVASMEDSLNDSDDSDFKPSPCAIVFRVKTLTSEARILQINAPTLAILRRCDGQNSLSRIVTEIESDLGSTGLEPGVVEAVTRLAKANILLLESEGSKAEPLPSPTTDDPNNGAALQRGGQ